jgi:hypothetical protein
MAYCGVGCCAFAFLGSVSKKIFYQSASWKKKAVVDMFVLSRGDIRRKLL